MPLLKQMQASLDRRQQRGMLRKLVNYEPTTLSAFSALADFSSNDYLSIATSEELKRHFMRRAQAGRIGGSTGSRLLDGNNGTGEMEQLEARLCRYFSSSHALLAPSGWEANVSLLSTVPQAGDIVLHDSLIHASVHDGMRRGRATCISFEHNDLDDFSSKMQDVVSRLLANKETNVFLAVESLYSMDGDYALLPELISLARRHLGPENESRLWVIVDEAHSGGVFGPGGSGLCQQWGLCDMPQLIRVVTFGKGFGSSGAATLCQSDVIRQYLINYARPLIFSTAISHSALLLIHASLDVLESPAGEDRRQRLYSNCNLLRDALLRALEAEGGGLDKDGLFAIEVEGGTASFRPRVDAPPSHSTPIKGKAREDTASSLSPSLLLRAVCNAAALPDNLDHEASLAASSSPRYPSISPILPLLTPPHLTRPLASHLQARGYLVRPITYPTVPKGKDRVRICVHSDNTEEDIIGLVRTIKDWMQARRRGDEGLLPEQERGASDLKRLSRL